jgi:hypothetical protein
LRDDGRLPRTLTLPTEVDVPPNRIRVPADFAGASAFEVFELVDDRAWPEEATYRLTSTIPRSTEDLPEHEVPEFGTEDRNRDDPPT